MKLVLAVVFMSLFVAIEPAKARSPAAAMTFTAAHSLRHAESVELLARMLSDLRAIQALIRGMHGLATEAANGKLTSDERMRLDLRSQQWNDQVNQIALGSSSSGISLLDGSNYSVALQVHPGRPLMWIQPLGDCTSMSLGLYSLDISTQAGASAALSNCESALASVESMLGSVRIGAIALGL